MICRTSEPIESADPGVRRYVPRGDKNTTLPDWVSQTEC